MKNYIEMTVKSKKMTSDLDYGRTFLSSFIKTDARLTPEYLDVMEDKPISRPFVDLKHALEKWSTYSSVNMFGEDRQLHDTAKWARKSVPIYSCYILNHTSKNMYNDIVPSCFSFRAKWRADIDWTTLFQTLCDVADAQAGMLHHFTSLEIKNPNGDFEMLGIYPAINPKFPDISWAMMFGDDFVYAVDVEKLTALGFPVEAVGSGYLVRVTDSLLDVSQRFDYFCERRELLRANLPRSIFTDPEEAEANRAEIERLIKERDAKAQLS